ncbi:MAG: DUF1566 domain-containing protein [Bacteroidota bacterium]
MKQRSKIVTVLAFCVTFFLPQQAGAQTHIPEKFSYQAVIRDADGNLVTNQTIGMQINILAGSPTGGRSFTETHTPTTNENGLVSIQIGGGTPVHNTISNLHWSQKLFLQTEVDPAGGTDYTITATSQLLTVPFALFAKALENPYTAGDGISIIDGEISAFKQYAVGLNATLGGYVFYVTPDGKHGLVAETQDQSAGVKWFEALDVISVPANHSNDGNDFTDWRLPTKYEISLMYTNKIAIGGFTADLYWSSTEYNGSTNAWAHNFNTGSPGWNDKSTLYKVRAVRSF